MFYIKCILLALLIGAALSSPLEPKDHHHHSHHHRQHHHKQCGECDPDSCSPPVGCLAGMVKDHCGCCFVCGRSEGEKCDNPDLKELGYVEKYGFCGEHLQCKLRDDLEEKDAPEALCYCKQKEMVCGTDGKSYDNICQLQEEAYRTRNGLKQASRGPCKDVPWIVTGPEKVTADEGTNVALSCEAMGYPVPSMEWRMTRPDGTVVTLPRDDQHIAAQLRGGPEQYEITGWLQILSLKPDDEGTYNCVAKNAEGEILASATVNVNLKVASEEEAEYTDAEGDDHEAADSKENKI